MINKKLTALIFAIAMSSATLTASAETVIKLGHFGPGGSDAFSKSVDAFAHELTERSKGRLKVQVYPAGQLGNERQQISALQGGLQEILVTASTNLTNMHSPLRLLDLPFVFGNFAEVDAVTTGKFVDQVLDGLDVNGVVGLALWENGFRVISNNMRPIVSPKDMKGIKMRVMGAPVFIDTFSALGTLPVPMPFPELYSGLETGTVDGQDNTAMTVEMMKFYEVQDYLTITNHMYSALIVLAGKPFLDRLSPEDRTLLKDVSAEFGATQRQIMRADGDEVLTYLANEGGMQIIKTLTPKQLSEFREAVAPVIKATVTEDLRPLYNDMLTIIKTAGHN